MTTAPAPALPRAMRRLPTDKHGRPVPWFVHWTDDGVPDFRIVRRGGIEDALRFGLCWVCGTPRGRHAAFVVGPMCAVNRVSAEPPAHLDCALYSALACPFLTTPTMHRRERGLGERVDPAGVMVPRNPGVALVWSSRTWAPFDVPAGPGIAPGVLFGLGEPTAVSWWREGRPATGAEVRASIDSGLTLLEAECDRERDPAAARAELGVQLAAALALVPA